MDSIINKLRRDNTLIHIVFIQFLLLVSIAFDISIMRQVLGFLYLTFIPGFVLMKTLRLEGLELLEFIIFSVGFSLSFLMFAGLLINEGGAFLNVLRPLSLLPLLIIINAFVLLLSLWNYYSQRTSNNSRLSLSIDIRVSDLLLIVPPILSVVGTLLVNTVPSNNQVLLLMIIVISLMIFFAFFHNKYDSRYPVLLLMISIALLLHRTLISNHLNGQSDIQIEYLLFKSTARDSYWSSTITNMEYSTYSVYNSMLSITILPTIFLKLLDMGEAWIFKIIYPIFFSFVPMGLYFLLKKQVSPKIAFLATFFFISYSSFYGSLVGLARLMVSEVFFVLLLFVLFNNEMSSLKKSICFIIFSMALVTSHYSMSFFFMTILLFTLLVQFFSKKNRLNTSFIVNNMVLFLIIQFVWYLYVSSSAPFIKFNHFISYVLRGLGGLGSTDPSIQVAGTLPQTFWPLMSRIIRYATILLIGIGFLRSFTKVLRGKALVLDAKFFVMSILNMILLIMSIVLPYFAQGVNMVRFYHYQLFFLSPFCILGGEYVLGFISNIKVKYVLILMLLASYFLFQTNFIYEITGEESWSISLSQYRMDAIRRKEEKLLDEGDVVAASWVSRYIDYERIPVYCDNPSSYLVLGGGHGMIYRTALIVNSNNAALMQLMQLNNETVLPTGIDSVIYLSSLNIEGGVIFGRNELWNLTDLAINFTAVNTIYANSDCRIYNNIP